MSDRSGELGRPRLDSKPRKTIHIGDLPGDTQTPLRLVRPKDEKPHLTKRERRRRRLYPGLAAASLLSLTPPGQAVVKKPLEAAVSVLSSHAESDYLKKFNESIKPGSNVTMLEGEVTIDVPEGGFLHVRRTPHTQGSDPHNERHLGSIAETIKDTGGTEMVIVNPLVVDGDETAPGVTDWYAFPNGGEWDFIAASDATADSVHPVGTLIDGTVLAFDPESDTFQVRPASVSDPKEFLQTSVALIPRQPQKP